MADSISDNAFDEIDDAAAMARSIDRIRREIAAAQARGAHAADRVRLLAVSKTVEAARVAACWRAGRPDGLAENKVQELLAKQEALPEDVPWHFIGHLQTNKVKNLIGRISLLHSLDSRRLAREIEKRSAAAGLVTDCLIEVNVGAEESKFGVAPAELWDFVCEAARFEHLRLRGLMTVAPMVERPEEARPCFARLRELRDEVRLRGEAAGLPVAGLQELSMGMSDDYVIAVEEGATMVRVGSRVFGARVYR